MLEYRQTSWLTNSRQWLVGRGGKNSWRKKYKFSWTHCINPKFFQKNGSSPSQLTQEVNQKGWTTFSLSTYLSIYLFIYALWKFEEMMGLSFENLNLLWHVCLIRSKHEYIYPSVCLHIYVSFPSFITYLCIKTCSTQCKIILIKTRMVAFQCISSGAQ